MLARDYQVEAEESLFTYFASHSDPDQNPVIAMPTGTGKSIVIAGFIKRVLTSWPGQRIMMLTHVKELIDQNADKLLRLWPAAPLGIYSAGLGEKTATMPITFAGIQSAAKNPQLFGHIDLVIIDECHLVSPDENAAYRKFLKALRERNPFIRIIGLSATPYRLGLGMITDGGIFTDVCYDITGLGAFNRLLDEGYLCPLVPMPTEAELDVSRVHKRGGEFISKELQDAVGHYEINREALAEVCEKAASRQHWLIFASGIDHINTIQQILTEFNIPAAAVHSKMTSFERDDNLARFKAGQIRALINADILTTGFDMPSLDCIVLLRPTSSPGLHVQILGRGTRPFYAPGFDLSTTEGRNAAIMASVKKNCLVLDFAGNTRRLGPINDPRIPKRKGEGTGDMPLKTCDACGCLNHISARFCVNNECGHEFTFQEKLSTKNSTLALIVRDEPQVELFKVDRVTYDRHSRPGSIPSLKVSYFCGVRRFTEWVCLEHHGNPIQHKAHRWWRERDTTGGEWPWEVEQHGKLIKEMRDVPPDVESARRIAPYLKVPTGIRVWVNKRYPEILSYTFEGDKQ